jgi:hypothetical protein
MAATGWFRLCSAISARPLQGMTRLKDPSTDPREADGELAVG